MQSERVRNLTLACEIVTRNLAPRVTLMKVISLYCHKYFILGMNAEQMTLSKNFILAIGLIAFPFEIKAQSDLHSKMHSSHGAWIIPSIQGSSIFPIFN